jgi:hypothetical protein
MHGNDPISSVSIGEPYFPNRIHLQLWAERYPPGSSTSGATPISSSCQQISMVISVLYPRNEKIGCFGCQLKNHRQFKGTFGMITNNYHRCAEEVLEKERRMRS